MNEKRIEIFMPVESANDILRIAESLKSLPSLAHVWFLSASSLSCELPANATLLSVESLTSTMFFRDMAERASADFVLFVARPDVGLYVEELASMVAAMPCGASMGYAHYRKNIQGRLVDAPVIECLDGGLRNDFDFGPIRLFRVSALKQYLEMGLEEFGSAGLYQLRLALSRLGQIYHFNGFVSFEHESDNRKSGEKQFDYVNPSQRSVQIEMERACTVHLKAVDAWLPPCKYKGIDLSDGIFPVEASVVIPVLNRETTIADAIASVLEQVASFEFNVLVVDNHSTDSTATIVDSFNDARVVHIVPERRDLGIGGCWNLAINDSRCGRFAVQLDSDDLYSSNDTLQKIVDEFYRQQCAMLVGTYRICDFNLNTLPPGVIDHREWTEDNGRNNALRINGLGAPRAFYTPVIREVGFPNVSYGEDYAVGLQISRNYRIGRIYDVLYLCRRWGGNSDAALAHDKVNSNNLYKDALRTAELNERKEMMKGNGVPSLGVLEKFFGEQLAVWPEVSERYRNLENVQLRALDNGLKLQYNPLRAVSASAKVDSVSIKERQCFLCGNNRPSCQIQESALGKYDILVNPYPILSFHFTLPLKVHTPQLLENMYVDMLLLAREWQGMAIFYNGAKCGASAPDHAHLQAVRKMDVPLFGTECQELVSMGMEPVLMNNGDCIYITDGYVVPLFVVQTGSVARSVEMFSRLQSALPCVAGEEEPRMNVVCVYDNDEGYLTYVVPRSVHRPACYSVENGNGRMVSPGALDMAGLVVTPRENDFHGMDAGEIVSILREVVIGDNVVESVVEKIVSCHEEC